MIGGSAVAAGAFTVAAVTLMSCVFAAGVAVARAERATLERIEARTPQVKTWTGWVLAAVGTWFLVLAAYAERFAEVFPV